MNYKILALLAIGVVFALPKANAQFKIEGKVEIASNKPAVGATVILVKAGDSGIIKINRADENGRYAMEGIRQGQYQVLVTHTGYQKYLSEIIRIDSSINIIEPLLILLQGDVTILKQVQVVAQKPFIEQKIDRVVINVSTMLSTSGNNALEVLEKMPGVIVDANGTISLKGKPGVLILIDGKQSYLSGDQLAGYLKSLQASQLDQIELMPNPPARYEAAGNAGVINIKIKKSKTKGFSGNAAVNIGKSRSWRTGESLGLNYRSGKFSLFANAGYSVQTNNRRLALQRNYFDAAGGLNSVYKSITYFKPTNRAFSMKAGVDYFVSPKTTIGIVFNGSYSSGNNPNPGSGILYNASGAIDSTIIADNKTRSNFENEAVNFNYSHQFDSAGKAISFDMDYVKYKARNDQTFLTNIFYPDGTLKNSQSIIDNLPADIAIYAAKTDYTLPLKNKGNFEAGLKTSFVSTDNEANYFTLQNNIPVVDYNYTNHFLYRENINAAYINFRKELKRITFQAGLRLENTNITGHQLGNQAHPDSTFAQHYTNLFPTAYILFRIDTLGNHIMKLSYGKRIDRPYYKDLNPFVTIVDKFTNFSGNPYLIPQLSSNYELTYSYKSVFTFSVAYSNTHNYQVESIKQAGDIFVSTTSNLGGRQYKAINGSINFKPAKWWTCNLYSEGVNLSFKSTLDGQRFTSGKTYFYIEGNNQIDLSNGWNLQFSGYFISSRIVGQFMLDPKGALNVGLQKKLLKNKATIRLSASDILRTTFSSGSISNIKRATSTYHNDFDNRMVTFGISYNFGASNNVKKRNVGSSQNEQGRVKN